MSHSLHNEIVPNSAINYVITGKFVSGSKNNFSPNKIPSKNQILLVRNLRFEIYEILEQKKSDLENLEQDKNKTLNKIDYNYLLDYKVFGQIKLAEKANYKDKPNDIIIIVIDYAKLCLLEYDPSFNEFKILSLYNFETDYMNKDYLPCKLVYSDLHSSILFNSYNNKLSIITFKKDNIINTNEDFNTKLGENYFEPSVTLSLEEANSNVAKVIKYSVINSNNENKGMYILILYQTNKMENNKKSEINNMNNNNNNNINNINNVSNNNNMNNNMNNNISNNMNNNMNNTNINTNTNTKTITINNPNTNTTNNSKSESKIQLGVFYISKH